MTGSATPPPDDPNPYAVPVPLDPHANDAAGVGAHDRRPRLTTRRVSAHRLVHRFLFRRIEIGEPLTGVLTYTGWWFVQRIYWNDRVIWRKISWWTLERDISFRFPPGTAAVGQQGRIEIDFGVGLRLKRFTFSCDGIPIYEEAPSTTLSYPR